METMIYLCRAERQGRMIAVAIRPESLYKNECPIEGHPFLPNDKPGILPIHLVGKCERKQGATEKVSYVSVWIENKCSPFQYDFKKLSIVPANETKKRLLKSGKDIQIYSYTIIISAELLFSADERQNITVERRNNTVDLRIEILGK